MSTLSKELDQRLAAVAALKEERDIIAQYTHLRAFESDFDKAQSTLRTIASAWLLAAIGSVGLVTQSQFVGQHTLDPAIAGVFRQALVLFAALGLGSLWFLDQRVYQSLLHSVFSLGCHLELATDKLLPIRCRAYLLNQDITHALGRFYSVPTVVLFLASVINFLLTFIGLLSSIGMVSALFTPAVWLLVLFTIFHIAFFLFIWCQSRSWATLVEQLPEALRTGHLRSNPNQAPTPNEVT